MKLFGQTLKSVCLASVAAIAVSFVAQTASAATASYSDPVGTCSFPDLTDPRKTISASVVTGLGDILCQNGNPDYSGTAPIQESFFSTTYTLAYKSDEAGKGDGYISFDDPATSGENAGAFGTWSLNTTPVDVVSVILGIKQGNFYAAFRVAPDAAYNWAGTWSTVDGTNRNNVYSHVDLWYATGERPTVPIPVPAAGILLITALGGLGFAARRRKAA